MQAQPTSAKCFASLADLSLVFWKSANLSPVDCNLSQPQPSVLEVSRRQPRVFYKLIQPLPSALEVSQPHTSALLQPNGLQAQPTSAKCFGSQPTSAEWIESSTNPSRVFRKSANPSRVFWKSANPSRGVFQKSANPSREFWKSANLSRVFCKLGRLQLSVLEAQPTSTE